MSSVNIKKLLVVALKPEWSWLKGRYKFKQHPEFKALYVSQLYDGLALLQVGCGLSRADSCFSNFLSHFTCEQILHFGSCGALDSEFNVADLLISKKIKTQNEELEIPKSATQNCEEFLTQQKIEFKSVDLFSSAVVLKNQSEKSNVQQKYKTQAVDMESFAVAKLCLEHNISYVSVRGVFDILSDNLEDLGEPYNAEGDLKGSLLAANLIKSPKLLFKLPHLKQKADLVNKALGVPIKWFVEQE